MHIHDDLQDVIARDTGVISRQTSSAVGAGGSAAFQTNLSRRFGSYKLIRDGRSVQQNLERRLSALPDNVKSPAGFKPETPVCRIAHLCLATRQTINMHQNFGNSFTSFIPVLFN